MSQQVDGKRVAILATHGFEESELAVPKAKLDAPGIVVEVVAPEAKGIRAWAEDNWGETYAVDKSLDEANSTDYHALVLPGGLFNPDALRQDERALALVRHFVEAGKPVAAICHAPWILINAGVVTGRTLTSYPSVKQDLENAGASWVDEPVVVDHGLVTSRQPRDLDRFCHTLVGEILEGRHADQAS
ncbi:type 1 glutamine amidotransferase domain-containing protein [Halomonas nitroreducens]|uniref:Type 1 glutamine amidotransferase n=1 Tax=Halomonas nitroreducens TaxID=447425 RepID=A0A431V2L4_9GAMM|nr:type 1 glutamine amidotransferase domain-containing protein [Halomonas nitroreducens]RTR02934.1 type 1 glutamine amidotransferase [Halomonas nitroreducens]